MRNKRKGYQTKKTPQKGTNGRCSTLVEESNGEQAAVNDKPLPTSPKGKGYKQPLMIANETLISH